MRSTAFVVVSSFGRSIAIFIEEMNRKEQNRFSRISFMHRLFGLIAINAKVIHFNDSSEYSRCRYLKHNDFKIARTGLFYKIFMSIINNLLYICVITSMFHL